MTKSVPEALAELGDIYLERRPIYGATDKHIGKVMKALFPDPVTLTTEADWCRMALYLHMINKLMRYATMFGRGGHVDSLSDLAVYSQMLQEYDEEERTK